MAVTDDMDFPRLTPSDDRWPSGSRPFRKPEELTNDQFDLLAAARAEGDLSGEALAELESVMASNPERRDRAESFRRIRLVPDNEKWPGLVTALRPSPLTTAFRRTVIPALLAIAAMIILIIYGPAGARLKTMNTLNMGTETGMTTAWIPASSPIIVVDRSSGTVSLPVHITRASGDEQREQPIESSDYPRIEPLKLDYGIASSSSISTTLTAGMIPVRMQEIKSLQPIYEDKNWMLRSISFLANAVTGKEKEINGYSIATGCINGINSILGWEMELDQVSNKSGKPVAVTFSSSLLSFTRPLNKTTP